MVGLPHWQSNYPCWECDASLKEEASRHGKWVKEIEQEKQNFVRVTSKEVRRNPRSAQPLFSLDGVTTRLVRGDGLHILFTKGVYAHLLGSVLAGQTRPCAEKDTGREARAFVDSHSKGIHGSASGNPCNEFEVKYVHEPQDSMGRDTFLGMQRWREQAPPQATRNSGLEAAGQDRARAVQHHVGYGVHVGPHRFLR